MIRNSGRGNQNLLLSSFPTNWLCFFSVILVISVIAPLIQCTFQWPSFFFLVFQCLQDVEDQTHGGSKTMDPEETHIGAKISQALDTQLHVLLHHYMPTTCMGSRKVKELLMKWYQIQMKWCQIGCRTHYISCASLIDALQIFYCVY